MTIKVDLNALGQENYSGASVNMNLANTVRRTSMSDNVTLFVDESFDIFVDENNNPWVDIEG